MNVWKERWKETKWQLKEPENFHFKGVRLQKPNKISHCPASALDVFEWLHSLACQSRTQALQASLEGPGVQDYNFIFHLYEQICFSFSLTRKLNIMQLHFYKSTKGPGQQLS